jgi:hypothetical protein
MMGTESSPLFRGCQSVPYSVELQLGGALYDVHLWAELLAPALDLTRSTISCGKFTSDFDHVPGSRSTRLSEGSSCVDQRR